MDLHTLSVRQASELLQNGEITSVALTGAILERIRAVEPAVRKPRIPAAAPARR
jgi:Asp-tRNA(Asn)/Glu-tRNA(Gln) amidotransferase A subunit family amidase